MRHLARRLLAAGAFVGAFAGCTLLSDLSIRQCETHADCDGWQSEIRRCENSRCVVGCQNNRHCAAFDPRKPLCSAVGSQCVGFTTQEQECYVSTAYDDVTMGELTAEDLTIVGAFASTVDSATWLSSELAVAELNERSRVASDVLPPSVVVLCKSNPEEVLAGMDHLVENLRAQAVVASMEDLALEVVQEDPALSERALLLVPGAVGSVAGGEERPLLWYLGGRMQEVAGAYAHLLQVAQDRPPPEGTEARPLRVASLSAEDQESTFLEELVDDQLRADGRDLAELFREARYRRYSLPDESSAGRGESLESLVAYEPDIVLVFVGGEYPGGAGERRLAAIAQLEAMRSESWSPLYVFGPRSRGDRAITGLAAESESFRQRAVGVTPDRVPDTNSLAELYVRLLERSPAAAERGLFPSELVYDGVYQAALATVVSRRRGHPAGVGGILDGLAQVVDPRADCVEGGPDGLAAAAERIAEGASFQLCGASGPPWFGPDHARGSQAWLFCWDASYPVRVLGAPFSLPTDSNSPIDTTLLSLTEPGSPASYRCAAQFFASEASQ